MRSAELAGFAGLLVACAVTAVTAPPASAATRPHWSSAKLAPGVGGDWSVPAAISCTGPGDCTAGGEYGPDEPYTQSLPFVANEASGTWHAALEVPGTSALNVGGDAQVDAVDCPAAEDCTAAGDYRSKSGAAEFFVVNLTKGAWRGAIQVPGLARLGTGAGLAGVSCPAATCEIGGTMDTDSAGDTVGFLVGEARGRWSAPHLVPGGDSAVTALSCPAAGDCAAGGTINSLAVNPPDRNAGGIVLDQVNGVWGKPVTVAPNDGLDAAITALSCAAARNCGAVGYLPEGWAGGPVAAVTTEGQ